MRVLAIRAVLALGLVLSGAALVAPTAARAASPGLVTSITWTGTDQAEVDRQVALMKEANVRWVRANIYWHNLEPRGRGQISQTKLAAYDYAIDAARAAGIQVLIQIGETVPYWASGDPNKYIDASGVERYDYHYKPAAMSDFAAFARFVAGHYQAKGVHSFEIWNEPNMTRFWPSGPNPVEFAAMLKAAYPAVKAADPAATVVMGGLWTNDFAFLEGIYRAGARGSFDAVAVHPYVGGLGPTVSWKGMDPGEDPNRISRYAFPGISEIRRSMDTFGDTTKPVWLTEFGWSTTTVRGGVSLANQASYLTQAYQYLERYPWVKVALWYAARDLSTKDCYECRFGLTDTVYAPKPSYNAFKSYAAEPLNTTIYKYAAKSSDRTPTFYFSSNLAGAKFECTTVGRPWYACSNPNTVAKVGCGSHYFSVRAVDPASGVKDATPARVAYTTTC
jgi:hypothetical protein